MLTTENFKETTLRNFTTKKSLILKIFLSLQAELPQYVLRVCFLHYRAAFPNLGYAYPQAYVKNLKGYTSSRITPRFSMKQLNIARKGVREFYFFLLGGTQAEKGWEPLL